jgi:DNA (cytosine-5)-methyltransferase 1
MDLGLEYAGLGPVRYQVEIDPFCRAVLAKHWPEAKRYDDVRTIDAAALEPVDLICFGSPCQDLSSAGSRAGLRGPKSRIFYDCLRVLEATRPPWVVFENVASGASRWVDAVRSELEQLDYATLPVPVAASWLGAWQQRARVFVVACLDREPVRIEPRGSSREIGAGEAVTAEHGASDATDSHRDRQHALSEHAEVAEAYAAADPDALASGRFARSNWAQDWSGSQPDMVRVVHGRSRVLDGARSRIAALGNAPTPQQVEVIGWVIRELMNGE